MTGMALPDWDQVRDLVQAAARVFAVQKSLGWDVALTDSGPLLLEGNWHYDLTVNQPAHRRGILDTPWVEVFNSHDAWRLLGLGFARSEERRVGKEGDRT